MNREQLALARGDSHGSGVVAGDRIVLYLGRHSRSVGRGSGPTDIGDNGKGGAGAVGESANVPNLSGEGVSGTSARSRGDQDQTW